MANFKDTNLDITFIPDLVESDMAIKLFKILDKKLGAKNTGCRRTKKTFGEKGLVYDITFYGKTVHYPVEDWTTFPELIDLKNEIQEIIGEELNICVVQWYPNGKVGINPHRDKEMVHGTKICGLSLGETRTLTLTRGSKQHDIKLTNGSLYVLNPPTNDYWAHSIPKDDTTKPRISLTFRNYK